MSKRPSRLATFPHITTACLKQPVRQLELAQLMNLSAVVNAWRSRPLLFGYDRIMGWWAMQQFLTAMSLDMDWIVSNLQSALIESKKSYNNELSINQAGLKFIRFNSYQPIRNLNREETCITKGY